MALGQQAKIANVKASLDQYLMDNLGPYGEEIPIHFEGVPFETTGKSFWIQPRLVDISRVYLRQGSSTEYGTQNNLMFDISIFADSTGVSIADKHYRIRDTIMDYFKIGQLIPLKDHVSGATSPQTLNYMKIRRLITDKPMPGIRNISMGRRVFSESINQYSLTWEIDYTELTTEP